MDTWYVIDSGLMAPAFNMGLDEALLESAAALARPVLRFYGWNLSAATFGYAQRFRDVSSWTPLRPLIRRPTGGGLVQHDADWTYSLSVPPDHAWYRLTASESYRRLHEWIQRAFAATGVSTELAATEDKPAPGRCFIGAERFDLVRKGMKLAGAAQRRNRLGLLIQGSVQPGSEGGKRADWETAMRSAAAFSGPVVWDRLVPSAAMNERAETLAQEKYSQAWHNERR